MYNYLQNRFALTAKGARHFAGGILYTVLLNITLFFPALFVFMFLEEYIRPFLDPSASITHGVWYYILVALAFMAVMFFIARLQYRSTYTCVYNESANRRIALAEKLRKLPLAFFGEKNLSDLTSTIMDDNTQLEQTFSHAVPQIFASVITITIIAAALSLYNWQLTISLFWVVPLALLVAVLSKKTMNERHSDFYLTKRGVSESIQEGLETAQEMKAYNLEIDYLQKLDHTLDTYEKGLIKTELVVGALVNVSHSLLQLGLATVIIVGATMLSSGSIDMFKYLVFLLIASRIYNPITEVLSNMAALVFLDVRIRRMKEMETMPVQQGSTDVQPDNFDICFEDVDFAYDSSKQVLEKVSFTAKQGEITALIGPSGGGKSTAAKLSARFWDIDSGTITLGGKNIATMDPETLLKNYSMVFQDVVLFNGSVKDNIRIGKKDATDEEIIRAARLAQCESFIHNLPNGYDTEIGENGHLLSGGERQRISIARALLKNAPIVLLDEATASIDVENETRIQAGISELVKNKTVLIIAHRMRTIAKANKIVVLKEGKVAEQGSPDELLASGGVYSGMCALQSGN